jgi:hypothetical protein
VFAGGLDHHQGVVENAKPRVLIIGRRDRRGQQCQEMRRHELRAGGFPRRQALAELVGGMLIAASSNQRPASKDLRPGAVKQQPMLVGQVQRGVGILLRHWFLAAKLMQHGREQEGMR